MERNEGIGDPGTGASGRARAGAPDAASDYSVSTGSGNASTMPSSTTSGAGGEARDRVREVKDAASSRLGQVKDKATHLKSALADKLESGADKLRQHSTTDTPAAAAAGSGATTAVNERLGQYGDALATGMERTAGWLRDGDLGAAIEQQVQEHPARTLLIALGIGYLIGRSLKD
jgi:ElaB/YqjD/DUF883 family membrane-anchored ribosome-binding protein